MADTLALCLSPRNILANILAAPSLSIVAAIATFIVASCSAPQMHVGLQLANVDIQGNGLSQASAISPSTRTASRAWSGISSNRRGLSITSYHTKAIAGYSGIVAIGSPSASDAITRRQLATMADLVAVSRPQAPGKHEYDVTLMSRGGGRGCVISTRPKTGTGWRPNFTRPRNEIGFCAPPRWV